jgi:hypothetical protein
MLKLRRKKKGKKTEAGTSLKPPRPSPARNRERVLREQLVRLLVAEQAHSNFDGAVADFPARLHGVKIPKAAHTPWQLLEHLRIAQWDILEFSRNPRHVSPPFPAGYWPPTEAPPDSGAWARSVRSFHDDLEAMVALVKNPEVNLFAPIPHGDGQTLLREALLVADHNAYHVGQFILLRRLADSWEAS